MTETERYEQEIEELIETMKRGLARLKGEPEELGALEVAVERLREIKKRLARVIAMGQELPPPRVQWESIAVKSRKNRERGHGNKR